jgi:hypothetical protein
MSRHIGTAFTLCLALLGAFLFLDLWAVSLTTGFLREDSWLFHTVPPSLFDLGWSLLTPLDQQWYHRPVRHWAYVLLSFIFGIRPEPFHLLSWLCVFGSLGFIYKVLRKWHSIRPVIVTCLAAYALAPVHAKTFFWTCALHNHLVLFFAAGALYFRMYSSSRMPSLMFFGLALYSRESAFSWLVPLLAADWFRLPPDERRIRSLLPRSWDLLALAFIVFLTFIYAGAFSGEAFGRKAVADPVKALQAHVAYVAVFFGWRSGEIVSPSLLRMNGVQLAGVIVVFLYGIFLVWRAVRRKEEAAACILAICFGGVAVLLAHPHNWQVEYAAVFGLGIAAMMCDGIHRAAEALRNRAGAPWSLRLAPLLPLLLLLGYWNGVDTSRRTLQTYHLEAEFSKGLVESYRAATAGLGPGAVILVESFAPKREGKDVPVGIYIPHAINALAPGNYVVFKPGNHELHLPHTTETRQAQEILPFVEIRRIRLESDGWMRVD